MSSVWGLKEWLETSRGGVTLAGFVVLLVVVAGLALAGFGLAVLMLSTWIGLAAGVAVAYPVSYRLRRRGASRGYARGLLIVWIAYVVVTALLIAGVFVSGPADPRAEPSGRPVTGFAQGFGPSFWILLVYLSRRAPRTNGATSRWLLPAFGLYGGGLALALLIGIVGAVYVFWPLSR